MQHEEGRQIERGEERYCKRDRQRERERHRRERSNAATEWWQNDAWNERWMSGFFEDKCIDYDITVHGKPPSLYLTLAPQSSHRWLIKPEKCQHQGRSPNWGNKTENAAEDYSQTIRCCVISIHEIFIRISHYVKENSCRTPQTTHSLLQVWLCWHSMLQRVLFFLRTLAVKVTMTFKRKCSPAVYHIPEASHACRYVWVFHHLRAQSSPQLQYVSPIVLFLHMRINEHKKDPYHWRQPFVYMFLFSDWHCLLLCHFLCYPVGQVKKATSY